MLRKRRKLFRKKRQCECCEQKIDFVDYKMLDLLRNCITERGKIIPRRISGNCARHQRKITNAVKRARIAAFLPFASE
jgi:small subunit ribosomal protein S18